MVERHEHTGTDSPKLYAGKALVGAPQDQLTASTGTTAGGTYTSNEQDIINNLIVRVDELELKLQTLGLLK